MTPYSPVVLALALPALRADQQTDIAALTRLIADLEAQDASFTDLDWLSLPLLNATGTPDDHRLDPTDRPGQPTPYLAQLPWCTSLLQHLARCGLTIAHARLLILRPGGMFWPHCDAHGYFRLLAPITSDPCLYRSGADLFEATVGTCYYFQPDAVHAAFNVGDQLRAVVCVDSVANRAALDLAATEGRRPAALTTRLPTSMTLEQDLTVMVQCIAEADAMLAGKIAVLLSSFCMELPIPQLYRLIHTGLLRCRLDQMSNTQRQQLDDVRLLIEQHPFFPRD